ncbi:AAA domain-containing protein [Limnoglobus roseus]|uniref:DNA-binding protein SMUBP-2 n=1 Tax=Limnoglobus roseus TaxID=2598579 RepID=A0A5C1A6U2_9BACT|nr:AAA domain-containing protein [Limnoglobus roseus]QEL13552.1 DNA-binding protein SMUBP-2 [Limnoglobus roseus]
MARIQIQPVPRKCSPGAVLAFVCNGGKLDRKQVGAITLAGPSAVVEVPDGRADAVIKALDGTKFSERPVRVMMAGKADFTGADHFARLSKLLDLEAVAEQDAIRRAAQSETAARDGIALRGLTLRESEFGLGGRLLLTFTRSMRADRLPPNRLQPGSPVLVNQDGSNRRRDSYRGVVFDREFTSIGVAIEPPDDDLPDDAAWRLDLSFDEVSRLRQQEALRRAATANNDRLAELRAVLLGEREPEEAESPSLAIASHLNEPQREAVRFALAAKDVAVIHGPPGTGKTTTVVELIRQAVARGERVLACAPSNHAVDNLLEKLLAAGEEPVRIGHPARVSEALRGRVLDLLVQKHADARQARKIAKDANALFQQADTWTREKPQPGEKAALRREARALLGEVRQFERLAADRILDEAMIVCGTLTGLTSDVLGPRRFDLAVIDEAAQSTEPACWLPLLRCSKVVLAGDHCQLPATILSTEAAEDGLAVSLMERLVNLYGDQVARLLTVQHRMNAAIMGFSNAQFYNGALVAHESVAGHLLCDLDGVTREPQTERPVKFIDTAGAGYDEELEDESGSRRNPQEATLTATYVRRLLSAGVPADAIGVITPYRAQVRLLEDKLPDVEVDSVDGFQGREKEAIVISLVRSNNEGDIGFLGDTRRTNVAFTRARRSLIVIGDSATLANHPFYQAMIAHFESIDAYSSVWEETE